MAEDYYDIVSKVEQTHLHFLRKMLGVNEVPEEVLNRYIQIKKIIDKIDARLQPFDLLRIAIDCGFDVATQRFEKKKLIVKEPFEVYVDRAKTFFAGTATNPNPETVTTTADPPEEFVNLAEVEAEPVIVEELPPESIEESVKEVEEEEPLPERTKPNDTRVSCFYNGEVYEGEITNAKMEDGALVYTILTPEGEFEVDEDDVNEVA